MLEPMLAAHALTLVPDLPRWIEARALLLSGHSAIFGSAGELIIRNDAAKGRLAVALGRASADSAGAILCDRPGRELMCPVDDGEHWLRVLPGWSAGEVLLYRLEQPSALAAESPGVKRLGVEHSLEHLPAELREELEEALPDHTVWCAFHEGSAASFAYSHWRTEGLFDISIDTNPGHRRRGLARLAVSELIRQEIAAGLQPVWGAMGSNSASQRLAHSLGFALVDKMLVLSQSAAKTS
ncbi:MAG: GNAT superfamily N-acetyltransferase [Pseudohongiellaceae bacterium]|jgi:GNAT superfamily N-acetyltransferase